MQSTIKGIWETRQVYINGEELLPGESQKVRNHSPDGFCWGYGGSGPAQSALAILLKFTNKNTALNLHQNFKWDIIAKLPQADFEVRLDIGKWILKHGNKY